MWRGSLALLLLFSAVKADFEEDCLALHAGSVKSTYFYGSCYVFDSATKVWPDEAWKTECTHMPQAYGIHLAVVPVKTISDMLIEFMTTNAAWAVWTALRQFDASVEPAGNWVWVTQSGNLPALAVWRAGYPNNANVADCAMMAQATEVQDARCSTGYRPLCQYVNPIREACWTEHQSHRFHNGTVVSDEGLVGTGIAGRDVCAKKCGRHILCFGYTMKRDDGHCWIHQDDGQWPEMKPIQDSDYDAFVKG